MRRENPKGGRTSPLMSIACGSKRHLKRALSHSDGLTPGMHPITQMAEGLGGWPRARIAEAKQTYGACDVNRNEVISGSEYKCLADIVITELERLLKELSQGKLNEGTLRKIIDDFRISEVVRLAISIASDGGTHELLNRLPLYTSTEKVLTVLEESIRRGRPLCTLPDC